MPRNRQEKRASFLTSRLKGCHQDSDEYGKYNFQLLSKFTISNDQETLDTTDIVKDLLYSTQIETNYSVP